MSIHLVAQRGECKELGASLRADRLALGSVTMVPEGGPGERAAFGLKSALKLRAACYTLLAES